MPARPPAAAPAAAPPPPCSAPPSAQRAGGACMASLAPLPLANAPPGTHLAAWQPHCCPGSHPALSPSPSPPFPPQTTTCTSRCYTTCRPCTTAPSRWPRCPATSACLTWHWSTSTAPRAAPTCSTALILGRPPRPPQLRLPHRAPDAATSLAQPPNVPSTRRHAPDQPRSNECRRSRRNAASPSASACTRSACSPFCLPGSGVPAPRYLGHRRLAASSKRLHCSPS